MKVINYIAIKDGTIEENLRELGISSSICLNLRKEMGLIKVNSIPKKIVDIIKAGTVISITLKDDIKRKIDKWEYPINIVYEDEDLAIIDKPQGMAVISTKQYYGKSLENALANIWGDFIYRPVNRLDKDTSGLMIIAKNQLSHSILSQQHITRKYQALCKGILKGEGIIEKPIRLKGNGYMERCIDEKGQYAKTKYKVLENFSQYSLVELELFTGRTHQIRVHMASINHPLLGDSLYDKEYMPYKLDNGILIEKQALHSYYINFKHPINKKEIELFSKPWFVKQQ